MHAPLQQAYQSWATNGLPVTSQEAVSNRFVDRVENLESLASLSEPAGPDSSSHPCLDLSSAHRLA